MKLYENPDKINLNNYIVCYDQGSGEDYSVTYEIKPNKCMTPKTTTEFNEKYKQYLEEGFYGLAIIDEQVIEMLDKEFEKEIAVNPSFKYKQIKTKFGYANVYADTDKCFDWESKIKAILEANGKLKKPNY